MQGAMAMGLLKYCRCKPLWHAASWTSVGCGITTCRQELLLWLAH